MSWLDVLKVRELYWLGAWDEAVGLAETVLAVEGRKANNLRCYTIRAQIRLARGCVREALDDADEALEGGRAVRIRRRCTARSRSMHAQVSPPARRAKRAAPSTSSSNGSAPKAHNNSRPRCRTSSSQRSTSAARTHSYRQSRRSRNRRPGSTLRARSRKTTSPEQRQPTRRSAHSRTPHMHSCAPHKHSSRPDTGPRQTSRFKTPSTSTARSAQRATWARRKRSSHLPAETALPAGKWTRLGSSRLVASGRTAPCMRTASWR
jgi:hypothetical protein